MKLKYLITSDWHLREDPGSRKQSREELIATQLAKISEIFSLATKHNCNAIIHGGDFFDTPKVSFSFFNTIAMLFKSLPQGPIMHVVPGNHDLIGYNLSSLEYSPLKTLSLISNRIKIETSGQAIPFTTKHSHELYNIKSKFIISHNSIFHRQMPFPVLLCSDLAKICSNKIVICGHIHRKFAAFHNSENALFLNPGPLLRTDISEAGITPSAILLEMDSDKRAIYDFIALSCAIPRETLFDIKAYEDLKSKELDIDQFFEKIQSVDLRGYNWEDMINEMAYKNSIPSDIVNEAIKRLRMRQSNTIPA